MGECVRRAARREAPVPNIGGMGLEDEKNLCGIGPAFGMTDSRQRLDWQRRHASHRPPFLTDADGRTRTIGHVDRAWNAISSAPILSHVRGFWIERPTR